MPVLTLAVPTTYVVVVLSRQQHDTRDSAQANSAVRDNVMRLDEAMSSATIALYRYDSARRAAGMAEVVYFVTQYAALRDELVAAASGDLTEPMTQLVSGADALVGQIDDVGAAQLAADASALAEWSTERDAANAAGDYAVHVLDARAESATADIDRLANRITWVLIAGLVATFVTGVIALLLFVRSIVGRIQVINGAAMRVVGGEPIGEVEAPAGDEIGELAAMLLAAAQLLIDANAGNAAARDAAVAATVAKDEFLSRMSHELRTPLTAILGFGQLLQMEQHLDGEDREAVDQIVKAGQHLLQLINELLDISRIATGHLSLSVETVNLADVVAAVVGLLGPQARGREITIAAAVPHDVFVLADHQRLRQVLLNLVSNAIKYNGEGGTVKILAEAPDGAVVRVSVIDNGPGISATDRERLFMPFERLSAPSTVEGTGVGLALSRSLVEAMQGTIGVESIVGLGTTFWVDLPSAPPDDRAADDGDRAESVAAGAPAVVATIAASGDSPGTEASNGPVLLYIEDNLANIRVMERMLRARDERLEVAMQGGLGLDLARTLQPDVIVLDVHLPDMSGAEVLSALKADAATAAIPVVVLSADATEGGARRMQELGAVRYLTKPIDVPALTAALDDCRRLV